MATEFREGVDMMGIDEREAYLVGQTEPEYVHAEHGLENCR